MWIPIIAGTKGTQVSHLLFINDMILFTEASMKQITVVNKCCDEFCEQSGQKVSVTKTQILFSNNVENSLAQRISE